MKFLNCDLLIVALAGAVASSSLTAEAFSLAPRGAIARNPYVSVARQVSLSDPNTSADVEAASDEAAPAAVRHTVYVGNLPFTTTQDSIRQLFEGVVTVKSVSLPTNPNFLDDTTGLPMSKGFAFVDVEREDEIETAIAALHDLEVQGRPLRVNKLMPKEEINRTGNSNNKNYTPDGQKKLYIGNLPFDAKKDEIEEFFGQYGEVLDLYIPVRDGQGRGFAFITMNEASADEAMKETDGTEFLGRTLVVNVPKAKGEEGPPRRDGERRSGGGGGRGKQYKLYIGNLSFYTTKEVLQGVFEEFGEVYDCYIPVDPDTDKPRGFAFLSMDKEAGEEAIAELDGLEIDGRFIRVNEAQGKKTDGAPRRNNSYGGGGGGY